MRDIYRQGQSSDVAIRTPIFINKMEIKAEKKLKKELNEYLCEDISNLIIEKLCLFDFDKQVIKLDKEWNDTTRYINLKIENNIFPFSAKILKKIYRIPQQRTERDGHYIQRCYLDKYNTDEGGVEIIKRYEYYLRGEYLVKKNRILEKRTTVKYNYTYFY